MVACSKCGKKLLKMDASNIKLSVPSGFEHKDCSVAKELPTEAPKPEVVEEKKETNLVTEKEVVTETRGDEEVKKRKMHWDQKRPGKKFKEESDCIDSVFRRANNGIKKSYSDNKDDESAKD